MPEQGKAQQSSYHQRKGEAACQASCRGVENQALSVFARLMPAQSHGGGDAQGDERDGQDQQFGEVAT